MTLLLPSDVDPSFVNGFARDRGESAYPELWDGLVGAWVPGLGKTGAVLRDFSGNKNHGALANADWVRNEGLLALDFDGINKEVVIPQSPELFGFDALTLSAEVRYTGSTSAPNEKNIIDCWQSGDTNYLFRWKPSTDELQCFIDTAGGVGSLSINTIAEGLPTLNDRQRHRVCFNWDGHTMHLGVDGMIAVGTTSRTGPVDSGTEDVTIGGQRSGSVDYWLGQIGPVSIYRRNLPVAQIKQLAIDPLAPFILKRRSYVFGSQAAGGGTTYSPHYYCNLLAG